MYRYNISFPGLTEYVVGAALLLAILVAAVA
jgi:hypothetical protein